MSTGLDENESQTHMDLTRFAYQPRTSTQSRSSKFSDPEIVLPAYPSSLVSDCESAGPSTPRRSPRNSSKREPNPSPSSRPAKLPRSLLSSRRASDSPSKAASSRNPKRREKRGYAPPETYAHLRGLSDCLKPELDVLFCGINPGRLSAQLGHHFANPNNHFWRALHESGFTTRRVLPQEDAMLPNEFNIGLTDLVDRPTAEENELSEKEKEDSVPFLLAKIARFRPRIVAFVGLRIAKTVEVQAYKLNGTPMTTSASKFKLDPGLQSFKLAYPDITDSDAVTETLFYAMPSSSGAVTQYQLPAKVRIMGDVRSVLEQIKDGTLDTGAKTAISVERITTTLSTSAEG